MRRYLVAIPLSGRPFPVIVSAPTPPIQLVTKAFVATKRVAIVGATLVGSERKLWAILSKVGLIGMTAPLFIPQLELLPRQAPPTHTINNPVFQSAITTPFFS
jgi:hypothetical protein